MLRLVAPAVPSDLWTPRTAQTARAAIAIVTTEAAGRRWRRWHPRHGCCWPARRPSPADDIGADDPGPASEPAADQFAPKVTVTSPTDTGAWAISDQRIIVVGVVVDDVSVTAVTRTTSGGATGTAEGTSVWSFEAPLEPGETVITVMARDVAGNTGRVSLTVVRR